LKRASRQTKDKTMVT